MDCSYRYATYCKWSNGYGTDPLNWNATVRPKKAMDTQFQISINLNFIASTRTAIGTILTRYKYLYCKIVVELQKITWQTSNRANCAIFPSGVTNFISFTFAINKFIVHMFVLIALTSAGVDVEAEAKAKTIAKVKANVRRISNRFSSFYDVFIWWVFV